VGAYLLAALAIQLGIGRLLISGLEMARLRMTRLLPAFSEWQLGPAESLLIHGTLTLCLAFGGYTLAMSLPRSDGAGSLALVLANPWLVTGSLRVSYGVGLGDSVGPWIWVALVAAIPLVLVQAIAARPLVLAERLLTPDRVREEEGS
jgi:hypothetical protein